MFSRLFYDVPVQFPIQIRHCARDRDNIAFVRAGRVKFDQALCGTAATLSGPHNKLIAEFLVKEAMHPLAGKAPDKPQIIEFFSRLPLRGRIKTTRDGNAAMIQKGSQSLSLNAMLAHVAVELDRQHIVTSQEDLMHPIARTERLVRAACFLGHWESVHRPRATFVQERIL